MSHDDRRERFTRLRGPRIFVLLVSAAFAAVVAGPGMAAQVHAATCIPATAPQPTMPGGDTVWIDDTLPAGASLSGVLRWENTQSASATQSVSSLYSGAGNYIGSIAGLNEALNIGETLVFYMRLSECAAPQEVKVQLNTTPYNYRVAYWGTPGLGGESGGVNMGPLPSAGNGVRMESPPSQPQL